LTISIYSQIINKIIWNLKINRFKEFVFSIANISFNLPFNWMHDLNECIEYIYFLESFIESNEYYHYRTIWIVKWLNEYKSFKFANPLNRFFSFYKSLLKLKPSIFNSNWFWNEFNSINSILLWLKLILFYFYLKRTIWFTIMIIQKFPTFLFMNLHEPSVHSWTFIIIHNHS